MRVLLQQPPSGKEAPRYVQLSLVPDLLGGWELLRESGQTGGRIQLRRELFLQHDEAIHAFEKARDGQIKHPVKNFRFNESPVIMLNNIEELGKPVRVAGDESSFVMMIPPMKLRDFTFTSLSDAV